jgi:DNA-directed RNA polymerase specialized sigma24 family protein
MPEKLMADTALNETYLEAWTTIDYYDVKKDGPLLTWMMAIARKLANKAAKTNISIIA